MSPLHLTIFSRNVSFLLCLCIYFFLFMCFLSHKVPSFVKMAEPKELLIQFCYQSVPPSPKSSTRGQATYRTDVWEFKKAKIRESRDEVSTENLLSSPQWPILFLPSHCRMDRVIFWSLLNRRLYHFKKIFFFLCPQQTPIVKTLLWIPIFQQENFV